MESIKRLDKYGNIEYKNEKGKFHRTDGPAYESTNGFKAWIINNNYHREDGPAIVYSNGKEYYYLNDKEYSKEDYEREILCRRLKRIKDL